MPLLNIRAASLRAGLVLVVGGLGVSACATQGYVDQQIAGVNTRIDAVDARVQDAVLRADAAGQTAQQAAAAAQAANQRIDQMDARMSSMGQMGMGAPRTPRN